METFGAHVEFELQQQRRRIERFNNEGKKLLQAHYADAIPFELFKEEQNRVSADVAAAEERLGALRESPEHSLQHMLDALDDLVRSSDRSYTGSGPIVRRLFNQAFFDRLEVAEGGQQLSRTGLAQPVDLLVRPEETGLGNEEAPPETSGQRRGNGPELAGGLDLVREPGLNAVLTRAFAGQKGGMRRAPGRSFPLSCGACMA